MQKRIYALLLATILLFSQMSSVALANSIEVIDNKETTHELQVGLWNATEDKASMANAVLTGDAILVEKANKQTMTVYTQEMSFMGVTAYLERLDIKQEDGTFKQAEIISKDDAGNATAFSFEVPEFTEYLEVEVYYGGRTTGSAARIKVLNYEQFLPVTTHALEVGLWNATEDKASHANDAFDGTGVLKVNERKKTITVSTQALEVYGVKAYLKQLFVKNLAGEYVEATVSSIDENEMPTSFTFTVDKVQEYYDVRVVASDDVHEEKEARLKVFNYSQFVEEDDSNQEEDTEVIPQPGAELAKIENGVFEVEVTLWNAVQDKESMANNAVRGTARIQIVNKVPTVYLYTKQMELMGIKAYLQELTVQQADGTYKAATIAKKDTSGNPTIFTFELPTYAEYIGVTVDPKIELMGVQNARIKVNYATLKEVSNDTDVTLYPGEVVVAPKVDFSQVAVSSIANKTYTGSAIRPSFEVKHNTTVLKEGTDYTAVIHNNTNVGTASVVLTGIGNYTGSKTITFNIVAKAVSQVTVSSISSQTYTGKAIKPSLKVTNGSITLKAGTDYSVSYSNNTKVGKASVTVTGKGNYTGSMKKTFTIKAQAISKATVSSIKNQVYTGKTIKPSVTIKYNAKKLKSGTDYTLSYSKNKSTGRATITIKGKGNFNGTKKVTFNIVPKKVTLSKLASKKSKIVTVSYKKVTGATGYQISYATSKQGKYKVAGTTQKTSYNISKLKSKKKVYVKVRAYKTINGKKVYASYSSVKSITVK